MLLTTARFNIPFTMQMKFQRKSSLAENSGVPGFATQKTFLGAVFRISCELDFTESQFPTLKSEHWKSQWEQQQVTTLECAALLPYWLH